MKRILTTLASTAFAASALAADGLSVGAGVNYSSGDYGSDTTTEILSIPVTARLDSGRWSVRASLPWVRVSGDPNVLPGVGIIDNLNPVGRGRPGFLGPPSDGQAAESGTASGLGDLTLAASYTLPTRGPLSIDLSANAKIATADEEKGLGTGANDFGLGVDLYRDFDGTMVFGGANWTRLGSSRYIDVDDVVGANVGISQRIAEGTRLGVMVEHRDAASSGFDDRREAMLFLNRTTPAGRMQAYASKGLSDGSPDWGAGLSFARNF